MKNFSSRLNVILIILFAIVLLEISPNLYLFNYRKSDKKWQVSEKKYAVKLQKIWSSKKAKIKGRVKEDSPNIFAEIQTKIRTAPGKLKPEYGINYRFKEFSKLQSELNLRKSITKKLDWIERGPGNVGGRTRAIIVDPDDMSYLTWFAGSVGGGVWKTTDGGNSWLPLTDNMPNLSIASLAMAASDHNIIYAGTGEGFYNLDAVDGSGIFKSYDKGESWVQLLSTANNSDFSHVNRIIVSPDSPDIVIAATNRGIFKSIDGGNSWNKKYYNDNRIQDLRANPDNFNIQYATSRGEGILRSIDGGNTWEIKYLAKSNEKRIEIAVAPSNPDRVYASVDSDSSKLYTTNNGGDTWVEVVEDNGNDISWLRSQGWYDNTIGVNPFDENIVYLGGVDLWRAEVSQDSIGNFKRNTTAITDAYNAYSTSNYVHADHHCLTMFPTNSTDASFILLDGNDGGIAVSYDGGENFTEVGDNGYNTSQFYGVDKKPGESQYFGGMQDNGSWESNSSEEVNKYTKYKHRLYGDGFDVSWHYTDARKIIGCSQYNRFYRTVDNWGTFSSAGTGFNGWGNSEVSPFLSVLAKSYSDPDLLYTITREGVYKSTDFASTWSLIPIDGFDDGRYFHIAQVKISIAEPQVVWAGAYSDSLYLTIDGGKIFNKVNDNTFLRSARITGLDTHPTNESTAYLSFSFADAPKILRTTDFGNSWEDISGFQDNDESTNGFPDVATYCVAVMPYDTTIIWAGTDIGLIESVDNGTTWHLADNGLPQVAIWQITIVDDQVVVATHGRGIWSVTLPELADHKPPAVILAPIINSAVQTLEGIKLNLSLRSNYDSTHILIDNNLVSKIAATSPTDTLIILPISKTGLVSISVISYNGIHEYNSTVRNIELYNLKEPQNGFISDLNSDEQFFELQNFNIETPVGFSNSGLNSIHNYKDLTTSTAVLRTPIIIAPSEAELKYDDIAIVEPGESGSQYGDSDFWDYVVVEGLSDSGWIPLADGYDCRMYSEWETAFKNGEKGTPALFRSHTINLLDRFSAGDTVLIRFRLYSDEFTNGWGWAIDNINIQGKYVSVEENMQAPINFALEQNYPNPFNPETTIKYSIPVSVNYELSTVNLKIYDVLGREVATLVNKYQTAGNYSVKFNASHLSSGTYYYKLKVGDFVDVKKMLLLK